MDVTHQVLDHALELGAPLLLLLVYGTGGFGEKSGYKVGRQLVWIGRGSVGQAIPLFLLGVTPSMAAVRLSTVLRAVGLPGLMITQ